MGLIALGIAACAPAARNAPPAALAPSASAPRVFAWPGTYDLVGRGFDDGDRTATLTIARPDTAYVVTLAGPPGRALQTHVVGDSVHVLWDLEGGAPPMFVALRGLGDSVVGRWQQGTVGGPIHGKRRP